MRILFVVDSLALGGTEILLTQLSLELVRYPNVEVRIVTLYPKLELAARLRGSRVEVRTLGMARKYAFWRGLSQLQREVEAFRPDVIHVHLFPANLLVALLRIRGRFRSIPIVFSEHNEWNRRRAHAVLRPFESWMYGHFTQVVCVSDRVGAALARWIPSAGAKILVIPNAVPLPERQWDPSGAFATDVLFVGRLVPAKGTDVLLHALSLLRKRGLTPRVSLVGAGPELPRLRRLEEEYGLTGQLTFLGVRDDVQEIMANARLLTVPSRWEGGPLVMLEGMAIGMPIIVTTVGDAVNVVEHRRSGLLVPPADPHALADGIERLLADPVLASEIAARGRQSVERRFSLTHYAAHFHALYVALRPLVTEEVHPEQRLPASSSSAVPRSGRSPLAQEPEIASGS